MKALVCKNCGGGINPKTLQCEYCGTRYQREFEDASVRRLVVESYRPDVNVLAAEVKVSEDMLLNVPADKIAEFTMRDMARSLAEALAPYIELETMRTPDVATQIIRGKVRVIEPSFRF